MSSQFTTPSGDDSADPNDDNPMIGIAIGMMLLLGGVMLVLLIYDFATKQTYDPIQYFTFMFVYMTFVTTTYE